MDLERNSPVAVFKNRPPVPDTAEEMLTMENWQERSTTTLEDIRTRLGELIKENTGNSKGVALTEIQARVEALIRKRFEQREKDIREAVEITEERFSRTKQHWRNNTPRGYQGLAKEQARGWSAAQQMTKIERRLIDKREYERKVSEIEDLIRKKEIEIERLREIENGLQRIPRRKFVKDALVKGATLAAGSLFMSGEREGVVEKIPPDKNTSLKQEKRSKEEEIEHQISKCREIIEEEKYEEILNYPFLVSALYYSDQAVKEMSPPHRATEEIIWNIYPLITKKFRENYMKMLKQRVSEANLKLGNANIGDREYSPLDTMNFGKDLSANHQDAIDVFTEEGSQIYSVSGGVVVLSENGWRREDELSTTSTRGGNTVIIFNPANETFFRYAHLDKSVVPTGGVLIGGEVIGVVGHSGINAARPGHGDHVHFEINKYNEDNGVMEAVEVLELKKKLETLRK